jgi:hypothetical protein
MTAIQPSSPWHWGVTRGGVGHTGDVSTESGPCA